MARQYLVSLRVDSDEEFEAVEAVLKNFFYTLPYAFDNVNWSVEDVTPEPEPLRYGRDLLFDIAVEKVARMHWEANNEKDDTKRQTLRAEVNAGKRYLMRAYSLSLTQIHRIVGQEVHRLFILNDEGDDNG